MSFISLGSNDDNKRSKKKSLIDELDDYDDECFLDDTNLNISYNNKNSHSNNNHSKNSHRNSSHRNSNHRNSNISDNNDENICNNYVNKKLTNRYNDGKENLEDYNITNESNKNKSIFIDDIESITYIDNNNINNNGNVNDNKLNITPNTSIDNNSQLKARIRESLYNNNPNLDYQLKQSNLKLEDVLHENDYSIKLSKLKRHVVIEIFGGKCFIREYLCTDFLKRVKQCCQLNYVKHKSGIINYRDCKQLLAENNNIASIEARLNTILISLPPLTCIILHSIVFLVVKEDLIRDDLIKRLCNVSKRYTGLYQIDVKTMEKKPFEFCALECVFSSVIEHLNAEMKILSTNFNEIKITFKAKKYQDILTNLHNLKEPANFLLNKINSFIKAFHEVSGNNIDLKKMELTKNYFNPNAHDEDNKESPNQDLQIMLEYFDQELDQIHDQIAHLYELIENMENKIVSDLSLSRNNLIRMDIIISLINSGFGIGTLITGVFGMNLTSTLEQHNYAFIYVTSLVTLLCFITVILSICFLKCIRI
ncbi:CorA-like Mg2+ transporter protein, putative [Hepatocystis sp. ex Piliocolobus tephrosceles]|nr:CorA-like Mg2+ transporter protein, putative [Hepatocystis sp. ex Piliocolobus tephrosceles]